MSMVIHAMWNKLDNLSKKHNIKVIYDAAHAFGSIYKNQILDRFWRYQYGQFSLHKNHPQY